MFKNDALKNHLETSYSIESESAVIAEWNMNIPGNVQKLGNYRYRENDTRFSVLPNTFDVLDSGGFYTGATDADVSIKSGFEQDGTTPQLFTYKKDKEKQLYSLEDCIKPFRPRSGINKLAYFADRSIPFQNADMFNRPRYYMPTRDDEFKYWRSYRTETSKLTKITSEYGISKNSNTGRNLIEDCNPFVTYKESVPANRIIVKVQTNIGTVDLGPFRNSGSSSAPDPFFGLRNSTVPVNFRVQYLTESNQWIDAFVFNEASRRDDQASPIFGPDGYLSLEYGIEIPREYRNNFVFMEKTKSAALLPAQNFRGRSYLVVTEANAKGTLYIYNGEEYETLTPNYTWFIGTDGTYENTHFVTDFTDPDYYNETGEGVETFREFVWMKGIRIAVETMSLPDIPLELIELSPRLVANLSNSLISFDITKSAADLASSALPVGQISAGVGSVSLFDNEQSFNENNVWNKELKTGSIISKHINKSIKFVFYERISKVESSNYYVPIKTLYSSGFPTRDGRTGETTMELRDFYFYFESLKAPRILLTDVSLSQAICILLDSIGFSNYVIKRLENESELVVPYFFIPSEQSVAETLAALSRATQSAMFFDEYNNFVVMTKGYMLDESTDREVDLTLYGSKLEGSNKLPNIQAVSSMDRKIYNAGTINYTSRYIKRTGGSIEQQRYVEKEYIYEPSLLWEVAGTEKTTTSNASAEASSGYSLSAVPLNTILTDQVPRVSIENSIVNNVFDIGENAYWLSRYQGFFYANGEILKYDAVEYVITGTGTLWITSNLEYQKYISKLPFNGKMYPTGLVRIFAEPFFETFDGITITQDNREISSVVRMKVGEVVSHGRGQFGTPIVNHRAGLDPYWSNNDNIQGCEMDSAILFSTEVTDRSIEIAESNNSGPDPENTTMGPAGLSKAIAQKTQRNGIIRNFLSNRFSTETNVSALKTTQSGTIQSSALVMTGPDFVPGAVPRDFLSYVYKPLGGAFRHFGTRTRIIGKVLSKPEDSNSRSQTVVGGMTYFNLNSDNPEDAVSIGGGSSGISLVNPETNNGYYFEISALTTSNIEGFLKKNEDGTSDITIDNILFYKIKKDTSGSSKAVPIKLWGGIGNIVVDDGNFAGQYRITGETTPTVYDLAMEYVDINSSTREFFLYINQQLVARITDQDPMPLVSPAIGLFVRGNSKAMFENVYALSKNYSANSVFDTNTPIASVFGDDDNLINASEALKKYALSGMIQNTYLSGIDPKAVPSYNIYFEEFGTILRECAYFNIKYDRAYPALYAQIAPTFNRIKGYTVSGFTADSYGAEFLIFNNTDTALSLDPKNGNYLRILGIAFTQDTTNTITVDDYLKRRGTASDPELQGATSIESPFKFQQEYDSVRQSRILYGRNEFTLESLYIQDQDSAEDLLGWIIEKNKRPRKSVGINLFSMPTLQLGDLVKLYYKDSDNLDIIGLENIRYVVYNINYSKTVRGPSMTVYLSEV